MSKQELERLSVIEQVCLKQLSQKEASRRLKISCRQIRRLQRRFEKDGPAGLISKQRGKVSNHQLSSTFKSGVLVAISSNYRDFGPKLATECLLKRQGLSLSVETTRQWMIAAGIWQPKSKKAVKLRAAHVHACT